MGWNEIQTWMAEFGGECCKPTTLIGNPKWLSSLSRQISKEYRKRIGVSDMVIRYEGLDGSKKGVRQQGCDEAEPGVPAGLR